MTGLFSLCNTVSYSHNNHHRRKMCFLTRDGKCQMFVVNWSCVMLLLVFLIFLFLGLFRLTTFWIGSDCPWVPFVSALLLSINKCCLPAQSPKSLILQISANREQVYVKFVRFIRIVSTFLQEVSCYVGLHGYESTHYQERKGRRWHETQTRRLRGANQVRV